MTATLHYSGQTHQHQYEKLRHHCHHHWAPVASPKWRMLPNWRNHCPNQIQIRTATVSLRAHGVGQAKRKFWSEWAKHVESNLVLRFLLLFTHINSLVFFHRIKPLQGIQIPGAQASRFHHNKYNIWSSSLQEEVMENLKGCGVDQDSGRYDRNCESYDYSLKYRLNGENSLKRRQSYSDDSDKGFNCSTSNAFESKNKRFRANSLSVKDRKNVRLRLGNRSDDSSGNEGSGAMNMARNILDLTVDATATNEEVAKDIADKLYEEKDTLMSMYFVWV